MTERRSFIRLPDGGGVEIPYLCSGRDQYDHLGWSTFPSRVGWNKEDIEKGDFNQSGRKSIIEAASFLQSWLFFGLALDFLGSSISQIGFLRVRAPLTPVISMSTLVAQISSWVSSVQMASAFQKEAIANRINNIAREARFLINSLPNFIDNPAWPLPYEVSLSILLLVNALEQAKEHVREHLPSLIRIPTRAPAEMTRQLQNRGWCQSDLSFFEGNLPLLGTYYISFLDPPRKHMDHRNCTTRDCIAMNIVDGQYSTKHKIGCTWCCSLEVDKAGLCDIIRRTGFPLVTLETRPGSNPPSRLSLTEWQKDVRFVAISHVWADGLGNKQKNALQLCQVRRIQQWVNDLYQPNISQVPFWIDTLCVPVKDGNSNEIKKQAISSMGTLYQKADAVLVLDGTLMKTSIQLDDINISARIITSGWLRRLWTLQEGVNARRLYFQLADGQLSAADMLPRLQDTCSQRFDLDAHVARNHLLRPLTAMSFLKVDQEVASDLQRINLIFEAFQWRSTSEKLDEIICFALVLGLDKHQMTLLQEASSPSRRLQLFIVMVKHFPRDMIFLEGSKMRDHGFRWCPQSLVIRTATGAVNVQGGEGGCTWTGSGIKGKYFGIQIAPYQTTASDNKFCLLFDHVHEQWYAVANGQATDREANTVTVAALGLDTMGTEQWISKLQDGALILRSQLLPGDTRSCPGTLLNNVSDNNGVLHGSYFGRVYVSLPTEETIQGMEAMRALRGIEFMQINMGSMVRTGRGVDTEWCVS